MQITPSFLVPGTQGPGLRCPWTIWLLLEIRIEMLQMADTEQFRHYPMWSGQRHIDSLVEWSNISTIQSGFEHLFVLLITTWLIINLGESIALIFEVKGTEPRHHVTVVLCIVLLSIIAGNTEDDFWLTYHDLILYWFTVGYICAYAVYHIESSRTINVIVGCMMLVSARFYQTFETPYATTFLFLIATRFFQKCYSTVSGYYEKPTAHWIYIRLVFMAVDVVLFCLLFTFSFIPSFKEKIQAWLYLQGLLYCSLCVGSFIHQYLNSKRKVWYLFTSKHEEVISTTAQQSNAEHLRSISASMRQDNDTSYTLSSRLSSADSGFSSSS